MVMAPPDFTDPVVALPPPPVVVLVELLELQAARVMAVTPINATVDTNRLLLRMHTPIRPVAGPAYLPAGAGP
jgi:hypothetical protein